MLTQARLKQVLAYDPESGVFTRNDGDGRPAGYIDKSHGYRSIYVDGREYYAHRLAWLYVHGEWPKEQVDHRNGDRADNRFQNLREATKAQNNKNRSGVSGSASGVKGVCWHKKAGKWMAQIANDGRHHYLGLFETIEGAKAAYDAAASKLHGDFERRAA